jgi:hypothetical protein
MNDHDCARTLVHAPRKNQQVEFDGNFRYWPEAAPHYTLAERLLLVKADTQNHDFQKMTGERLLHPRYQPLACYSLGGCY